MVFDLEDIDKNNFLKIKKSEKEKEELLDESFKRVELSKKKKKFLIKEKKEIKKFFPVFGVIFIVIAIVALLIINYLPWMYIKYNNSDYQEFEGFFYRDFKTKFEQKEILDLFGSNCNNCSSYSHNYIGLSTEDFIYSPQYCFYGFIALILLGLISIIFAIIDKFRNFSIKSYVLFYFISGIIEVIIGVYILSICVKFLGANFLLFYNKSLIEGIGLYNAKLLILAPILLIVFAFILIKGAMIAVELNFKKLEKRNISDKTSGFVSAYKYGSNIG